MREIKFRAWNAENNEMVNFRNNKLCNDQYQMQHLAMLMRGDYGDVLMQFTGLTDCNGVKIFEGDIVEYKPYYNLGHSEDKLIGVVHWGETGDSDGWSHGKHYEFTVGGDSLADVADSDYPNEAYCKVIGNIHQNPELLERTHG